MEGDLAITDGRKLATQKTWRSTMTQATAGTATFDGKVLTGTVPNGIGAVFQQDASFFWLSVWDNVAFGLRRRGSPQAEIERRVNDALAFMCNLAATGPVISVSVFIGSVRNVTPSPIASKVTFADPPGAFVTSFCASAARWNLVHCVSGSGQSFS